MVVVERYTSVSRRGYSCVDEVEEKGMGRKRGNGWEGSGVDDGE